MASEDVLGRDDVERVVERAAWSVDPGQSGIDLRERDSLLAHDASLRARIEELEGLIGEAASTVEQSMPSELRDTMLNEWVPRARRALESDHGEQDNGE